MPKNKYNTFLAIDSSIGSSVALSIGDKIFELESDNPMAHTEVLAGLIDEVLQKAGISAKEVEAVVQGVGPGPFTGLRVGLATAQSFAFGVGVPLLSIVSHDAAAFEAMQQETQKDGGQTPVRIIQDAKRRELFISEYSGLDEVGLPIRLSGPLIQNRSDYFQQVEQAQTADKQTTDKQTTDKQTTDKQTEDIWPERIKAANLIRLAEIMRSHKREFADGSALYLRQPDVNLMALQKQT
ncbi:MAG TPA: tRNA (adenosine(37)-N6)-threonylcarbamoyltransferase complex dimerization subunit type 1 TsaB [Microbacteriaceae bacterium]|nr:tRNA (adenosine(37)-N6)-threonylcarbamoyltransferase complex dimerization subunit type 1 TsaB [Microbacteriaceae bacterium]